jgi:predicted ATPase
MRNHLVTPKKDDFDNDSSKKPSVEAWSRIDETAMAKEHFYAACKRIEIPKEHISTIYSLVFHHVWPSNSDSESDTDTDSQSQDYQSLSDVPSRLLLEEIAKSIVSMFLQATVDFDILILGIDDLSLMDEVSWKVLQLLFEHACNVMIIGTSRPTTCKAINIDPGFWNYLFSEAVYIGRFMHIDLLPLRENDVRRLIIHYLENSEEEADNNSNRDEKKNCSEIVGEQFSHEIYLQSGGNPRLVAGMIEKYASIALEGNQSLCASADAEIYRGIKEKSSKRISAVDVDISEHVLHRLDSLPAIVRTHLNLGALVGFSFSAKDVISVMEQYRGVPDEGKQEHAEFVYDSLSEAVWHGILEVDEELVTTGEEDDLILNTKYRFSHKLWREQIIDLTLDDWQKDMQQLISSTFAT